MFIFPSHVVLPIFIYRFLHMGMCISWRAGRKRKFSLHSAVRIAGDKQYAQVSDQ